VASENAEYVCIHGSHLIMHRTVGLTDTIVP